MGIDKSTGKVKRRSGGQGTGAANSQAKFADNEIRMMREYRAGEWTYKELGLLFACAPTTAAAICTGKAYPDSPGPIVTRRYNSSKRALKRLK